MPKKLKIITVFRRYEMKNNFFERAAIANGLDPNKRGFMCGGIISVDSDGYWILLLGTCRGRISRREAVPLEDVLLRNPNILIAADRAKWYDEKCFVGGVVIKNDEHTKQYMVKVSNGTGYISHNKAILVERIIAELDAATC
jgi:hypothetical protein